MEEVFALKQNYIEIAKRRATIGAAVAFVLLAVTVTLAFGLPSVYRSRSVILIEAQEIPQDLVRSLVTSFADQRMQTIAQRVLTNANLSDIIKKYDLYGQERKTDPLETVLEKMRDDIAILPISADVVDPRQGKAVQATIAFELAYESRSPEMAQRVANEIVSLFLNENLKQRTEASQDTLSFLNSEAERLRDSVAELEAKLASFKKGNVERLPELQSLNIELMNRTEVQLDQLNSQLQSLNQQRVYLESELAQQKPMTQLISEAGERILGPADRLRALEAEFPLLAARYGPSHPDVVTKRKEIAGLRDQLGGNNVEGDLSLRLEKSEADLALAQRKYSQEHPDVQRLSREVDSLKKQLATSSPLNSRQRQAPVPDNPAYIQLQARLSATDSDIRSVQSQQASLRAKLSEIESRITNSPEVERQYRMLSRDYEIAQAKYQEVLAKKQEAELASSLESKQRGERFTLIEPPIIPEEPFRPNRLAIGVIGLFLSLAGGFGGGAIAEALDNRIYGRNGVVRAIGSSPLAVIPDFSSAQLRARGGTMWLKIVVVAMVVTVITALVIHFAFGPLDVFFFRAIRVLGMNP